ADRDWVHLEARYNYEDTKTASVWFGYNYELEKKVSLYLAPIIGDVVGQTSGIGLGYYASLGWWWLELYTEGQFVIDVTQFENSYFYAWTEFTLTPIDWIRFG